MMRPLVQPFFSRLLATFQPISATFHRIGLYRWDIDVGEVA
jgi:hypothetical protein